MGKRENARRQWSLWWWVPARSGSSGQSALMQAGGGKTDQESSCVQAAFVLIVLSVGNVGWEKREAGHQSPSSDEIELTCIGVLVFMLPWVLKEGRLSCSSCVCLAGSTPWPHCLLKLRCPFSTIGAIVWGATCCLCRGLSEPSSHKIHKSIHIHLEKCTEEQGSS